jgi:hypothetical protein
MMDASAHSPSVSRARWRWPRLLMPAAWRFSIRELLLLTTAVAALVAAFLAWYRDRQPFARSLLSQEFGTVMHIRTAAAPLYSQPVQINGGGGGSGDRHSQTIEYSYSIALPRDVRGQFMSRLNSDAHQMMSKDRSRYRGITTNIADLSDFSYTYHGGPSRGVIVVRRVDRSDDEMHLSILIYEHEDQR